MVTPEPEGFAVAVAQFAPGPNEETNLATIRSLAELAALRGARLVVFPEYSSYFVDPFDQTFAEHAQSLTGPFVTQLAALSSSLRVVIVAGLVEQTASASHFSNTLVAVTPGDGMAATYRKQHLYDAFGAHESDWVTPGSLEPPEIVTVDGLKIGLQTCYDIRFPEVTRRLVDAGADVVLVPAEWVRGTLKEHHWRTLVTARAIENTIYVVAADHSPPLGVGASMIVDPMGVSIAEVAEPEGLAVAWISADRIARVRSTNPSLAARRYRVSPILDVSEASSGGLTG